MTGKQVIHLWFSQKLLEDTLGWIIPDIAKYQNLERRKQISAVTIHEGIQCNVDNFQSNINLVRSQNVEEQVCVCLFDLRWKNLRNQGRIFLGLNIAKGTTGPRVECSCQSNCI